MLNRLSPSVWRTCIPWTCGMAAAIAFSVLLSKFGFTPLTPLRTGLVSALLVVICLLHLELRPEHLPLPVRRMSRGLAVIFCFILSTKYSSFPTEDAFLSLLAGPARWLMAVMAAAAWRRPALLLLPVVFTGGWHLDALSEAGGIPLSHTDLNGLFVPSMVFCTGLLIQWRLIRKYGAEAQAGTPWMVLMVITTGIFFSNYFYSGIAKLALDGGPLSWWLENHTAALFLNTWDARQTPLSAWPTFCAWLYQLTAAAGPLINTAVLCIELLPLLAFFRWRWMAAAALGGAVLHSAIFLMSGVFFWKWLWLDVLLIAALWPWRTQPLPRVLTVMGVTALLLAPVSRLWVARLGWYDTRSFNHIYLLAHTRDGKRYRVPSNYFLTGSITYAQMRIGLPLQGHFPTLTGGATLKKKTADAANACKLFTQKGYGFKRRALRDLGRQLRKSHQFILSRVNDKGLFPYDFYPHHIWSNPLMYAPFMRLDKRAITAFELVAESVCLDVHNGRLVRWTRKISQARLPLP